MLDRRKFIKATTLTAGALLTSTGSPAKEINDVLQQPQGLFLHGVASGDPLSSQVIIWTRINPEKEGPVLVKWVVSKDVRCTEIVRTGEVSTNSDRDHTVKIDVSGLAPSTTYYYQFICDNVTSVTGRTKTTPFDVFEDLQFAVVSCSDYSAGYYNALARIAERKELNAVVHLGDYIYEGTERSFAPQNNSSEDDFESIHFNRTRDWWLHYYRKRYLIYRLDPDLQAAHKVHPFITIWDDHEIANNAWKGGAQSHDPEIDGDWEIRKSAARQAYAEWMPIRGNALKIYRSFRFGKMAELILLDTRIEGRDQQINDAESAALFAGERTMLGKDQKDWLLQRLEDSPCQWKLIGSQVVFSEFNIKWLSGVFPDKVKQLENVLLDYWEGYPAERDQIINHISKRKMNNVVILSASMHCALAFDVTARATKYSRKGEPATYDPVTKKGSVAVEFAATSITSANFDENMSRFYANTFQSMINKQLPPPLNYNPNPHLKFADLQRHGYFILDLTKERAEASFFFVDALTKKTNGEKRGAVLYAKTDSNHLTRAE